MAIKKSILILTILVGVYFLVTPQYFAIQGMYGGGKYGTGVTLNSYVVPVGTSTLYLNDKFYTEPWIPDCGNQGSNTYGYFPRSPLGGFGLPQLGYDIIDSSSAVVITGSNFQRGPDYVQSSGKFNRAEGGDILIACPTNFSSGNPDDPDGPSGSGPPPGPWKPNIFRFNNIPIPIGGLSPGIYEVAFNSTESPGEEFGNCDTAYWDSPENPDPPCNYYELIYVHSPGLVFEVTSSQPANINITTNLDTSGYIDGASLISGPSWLSGQNNSYFDVPPGAYTIHPDPQSCNSFSLSGPATQTVNPGETITFNIVYTSDGSCGSPPPSLSLNCNGQISSCNITSGQSATINWSTANATSCTIGPWSGTSGPQNTGPLNQTTTYTLSCSGPGGSANASVTVNVSSSIGSVVSGYVYHDLDTTTCCGGVYNQGTEPVFAGETVTLTNQSSGAVLTAITDASGYYVFTGVQSGQYLLSHTVLSGYVRTTDDSILINVP